MVGKIRLILCTKLYCYCAWFFTFLICAEVDAQNDIPIGTWRSHFSYFNANHVAVFENNVYCATENGFFIYDKEEGSTTVLSKINGLSDTGISALNVAPNSGTLVIGYENGNIDLLSNNEITNFDLIKETDVIGSKRINHIHVNGEIAYISADVGMIVFDLENIEIMESYIDIGPNGASIVANSSTIYNDSLFVATNLGILRASLDPSINKLDFRNWLNFNDSPIIGASNASTLDRFENGIFAAVDQDSIYFYNGESWDGILFLDQNDVNGSNATGNQLVYSLQDQLLVKNNGTTQFQTISNEAIDSPKGVVQEASGRFWIADNRNGLVNLNNDISETIRPNGPFSDQVEKMIGYEGKIVVVPGGFENDLPIGNEAGFYEFTEGRWQNYNASGAGESIAIPTIKDLVDIAYDPITGTTYFASFGYGILQWDNENEFEILNENSPGSTLINSNPPEFLTRISAIDVDFQGNLWLCNYGTDRPLHVYNTDASWQFFAPSNGISQFTREIIIPNSEDKWLRVDPDKGGSIILYNDQTNATSRLSRSGIEGAIPSNRVLTQTEDQNGQVWVGSSNGIVYFPTSFDLLEADPKGRAIIPIFEGFGLLADQNITKIAIDGGNRKWVGTDQGIWLFEDNGESLVFNFTEKNSPLPSNTIKDIAINQISGEVFIATAKGIVSFRSTATRGTTSHSNVKVFPNPVTKSYTGTIGISGLANNAVVKITDIAGKLIFETRAQGGTAVWNGRDYTNRRASTGIYLVLSATESGEEKFIGKIAIID